MDTQKSSRWSVAVIFAACTLSALAWSAATWAGPGSQPQVVELPAVLQSCENVPDHELQDIRGRYDRYYFGMNIIVNLTGSGSPFTLVPHPNNTPGTEPITKNGIPIGIKYNDDSVTYRGGVRPGSVYQAAQVRGNGKAVIGVVNLDIRVPQSLFTTGVQSLSVPNPRQGITY